MSVGSRDYYDLMKHLRDANDALRRAEAALDLLGPADLARHPALDDVVAAIQGRAELVGRRTAAAADAAARCDRCTFPETCSEFGRCTLEQPLPGPRPQEGNGRGTLPPDVTGPAYTRMLAAADREHVAESDRERGK